MTLPTVSVTRERSAAPAVAVTPEVRAHSALVEAVADGGGRVVPLAEAEALVWAVPTRPDDLAATLSANPGIRWIQLPFAGVDAFLDVLDHEHAWTSAKGAYDEPVAEMALALVLATRRHVARYAAATRWEDQYGQMLYRSRVVVLGGGAISRELVGLLAPFDCHITVVRRSDEAIEGTTVVPMDDLDEVLDGADVVVLALALTPETSGIIDRRRLDLLHSDAVVVNVARGEHVVTGDLVAALRDGSIAGAGLDVTDPEPLPDGHPLWSEPNVVITPHVGNTEEMGVPMLARRISDNVSRYAAGEPLLGAVDADAGY